MECQTGFEVCVIMTALKFLHVERLKGFGLQSLTVWTKYRLGTYLQYAQFLGTLYIFIPTVGCIPLTAV